MAQVVSGLSSISPFNIIPPWFYVLLFHLGDEQKPVASRRSETTSHPIDMNNISAETRTIRVRELFTGLCCLDIYLL
jgi:hypothetical protein